MRFRVLCLALILITCAISTAPVLGESADVLPVRHSVAPADELPVPPQTFTVKVEGFVTSTYETLPGDIMVNGSVIHVSDETFISPAGYKPEINDLVLISALYDQGELYARVIHISTGVGEGHPIEFRGIIEQLPANPYDGHWMVNNIDVRVDVRSEIDSPTLGYYAHVQGIVGPDGSVQATKIQVFNPLDVAAAFEVEGFIEQIGEIGSVWMIAGVKGQVTEDTEIEGNAILGAFAEVCGRQAGDDEIIFEKIRVWSDQERKIRIEGSIEQIDVEDGFGYWIVNGQSIEVDERTFVDESSGRARIGMWAEVTALPNGLYPYALRIRVRRPE